MIRVTSFYMHNINPDVVKWQRAVMNRYYPELDFDQILTDKPHGRSMDDYLANRQEQLIVFLDIDAIPLNGAAIWRLLDMTNNGQTIAGAPQRANHIKNGAHIYVAPSIMAISPELYRQIGSPSASETYRGDVAEEWTYALEDVRIKPCYLDVLSHDPSTHWQLDEETTFGLNTYYGLRGEPLFFHSFQGRSTAQQNTFIKTCQGVLSE